MQLTLGPNLYYWNKSQILDFYQQACNWPIDTVYLGETVCARRHQMRLQDWIEVAQQLHAAGKKVIFSSLSLIESEADAQTMQRQLESTSFLIEANEMGAVQLRKDQPFVAGAGLNIYNAQTLDFFARIGATRWVMPVEMAATTLRQLLANKPQAIQTEVFAFGRLPLAISARCFTARHYNLPKDDCQFKCLQHPAGLAMQTREGQAFLTLNGVQTQSAKVYHLLAEIDDLKALGVDSLRISPQPDHTGEIIQLFWQCIQKTTNTPDALQALQPYLIDEVCNGYWHGTIGMEQHARAGEPAALSL